MKTTIDLPDALLVDAKAAALKRRTTLKAVIEHALRRELYVDPLAAVGDGCFRIDEFGLPVFGHGAGREETTSEKVYELMEELGV